MTKGAFVREINLKRCNRVFKSLHKQLSFVKIDSHQRKIKRGDWQNEFERPIYFVELRDSYVCSWCELVGSDLMLIPSPQSRTRMQHVRFREDAKVVGRVIGVTMQIAEMQPGVSR